MRRSIVFLLAPLLAVQPALSTTLPAHARVAVDGVPFVVDLLESADAACAELVLRGPAEAPLPLRPPEIQLLEADPAAGAGMPLVYGHRVCRTDAGFTITQSSGEDRLRWSFPREAATEPDPAALPDGLPVTIEINGARVEVEANRLGSPESALQDVFGPFAAQLNALDGARLAQRLATAQWVFAALADHAGLPAPAPAGDCAWDCLYCVAGLTAMVIGVPFGLTAACATAATGGGIVLCLGAIAGSLHGATVVAHRCRGCDRCNDPEPPPTCPSICGPGHHCCETGCCPDDEPDPNDPGDPHTPR
jgi:hypothetical protein